MYIMQTSRSIHYCSVILQQIEYIVFFFILKIKLEAENFYLSYEIMQILQFYKNKKEARRASDQDKAASCQHVGVVCLAALKNKLFPMDYVPGFFNISFGTLF